MIPRCANLSTLLSDLGNHYDDVTLDPRCPMDRQARIGRYSGTGRRCFLHARAEIECRFYSPEGLLGV